VSSRLPTPLFVSLPATSSAQAGPSWSWDAAQLSPLDDETLKGIALRIADVLVPGGLCVLVNHYFFVADSASRRSRRIHRAFAQSPRFRLDCERRKSFFLVTLLTEQADMGWR
jgi:hypothetical protein